MKAVILDGYTTNPGDLSWNWLEEKCELTVYDRTPLEETVSRCKGYDIIITNKTPLGREVLEQLPECKFIALLSTGYNIIDCEFAASRGIPVSNIPSYSTSAVAQLTFAFILELCNKVAIHNTEVKKGKWSECKDFCFWRSPLQELLGKTLGIIGFGSIGSSVARIACAFGMNVIAHTANPDKYKDVTDVRFVTLDELLEKSDIVSLHCPLTAATTSMVNADFLSKMKNSAYIINTSRGPVVDEQALANALKTGKIAGAGVDVLSSEPPSAYNPLLSCENCLITPHIAWAAFETRQRLMSTLEKNISAFLSGAPINTVNM